MPVFNYDGSAAQDCLLGGWWAALTESGEITTLMLPQHHGLADFMAAFQRPTRLWGAADGSGLWLAVWGTPWFGGALIGLWVRPDRRRTKAALAGVETALAALLAWRPILLATVTQAARLRLYRRMGLQITGAIPNLWNGEWTWLGWLTAETFAARRPRLRTREVACA